MKIALISTTMGIGGAEKQVTELAASLHRNGHEVTIISCKGPTKQDIPDGVRLIELRAQKTAAGFAALLLRLIYSLRVVGPDVAHSHMVVANLLTRIAKPFCRWPVVISTAHNTYEGGGRFRIIAYRATDSLADLTTNVSQEAVHRYVALGAAKLSRIKVVYNGVDFERYRFSVEVRARLRVQLGVADSTRVYLAVGRLAAAKDYPNLLRAFAIVTRSAHDTHLLIAGEGPERQAIDELAASLGIASKVTMLGVRSDVPELMCAADVFVLSSAWEGCPLVITEAIACHLTVVATNSGGVAESLDGYGQIVPVSNCGALAASMLDTLPVEKRESDQRVIAAREHARKRFAMDNVARNWLRIYDSLLEARAK